MYNNFSSVFSSSLSTEVENFRSGLFTLSTSRFGKVAELMIAKKYNFSDSPDNSYDLVDNHSSIYRRVEVCFSRVTTRRRTINRTNAIEMITTASSLYDRSLTVNEAQESRFSCTIQQIKPDCFDKLYYGLFFKDYIYIFSIMTYGINRIPGYSPQQHRGNSGEGAFHINNDTFDYHYRNNYKERISYNELYRILD